MPAPLPPLPRALQRLAARTDRGPLRPLWRLGYELAARLAGALLTAGVRDAAAYVRGSVAHGDAVHGVSDIDLIVLIPGDPAAPGPARRAVERRWAALARRVPALAELVSVAVYERRELVEAARAPAPLWPDGGAVFTRAPYLEDSLWLRVRPGLVPAPADWRRVRGPDRRPPAAPRDAQAERVAAWLELQWWWRHALAACSDPGGPRTRYLLVKFVAEPVRLLLSLEHGERPEHRRAVLERGLRRFPEEEPALRDALALLDALPRRPVPPIERFMPHLVHLSGRVAATLAAQVAPAGRTAVRLYGAGAPRLLGDWRALALPPVPEERMRMIPGSLGDPAAVAAARATPVAAGTLAAMRAGDLLAVPLHDLWHGGFLRTLHCSLTAPVAFADGDVAWFPDVAGWSAADLARRATAERGARLLAATGDAGRLEEAIGVARAGLLTATLAEGAPELALPADAVAARLAAHGVLEPAAADGVAEWAATRAAAPDPALATAVAAAAARLDSGR